MKLKTLFSTLLLINILSASGQILYTDFAPDIYLTNQPLGTNDTAALDINQDGTSDLTVYCKTYFEYYHNGCCWYTSNGISFNPASITFPIDTLAPWQSLCMRIALDSNIWVGSNLYYPTSFSVATIYAYMPFGCGSLLDSIPKFYPFRLAINSDTLYGWIRIETHPTYMIIYDAALNLLSNDGLYTGQIATGVNELNENFTVKLVPNPITNELSVKVNNNSLSEIILHDIASRKILQQKFTSSVLLNVEPLAKGLYVYEVRTRNGLCKQGKVMKD